MSVFNTENTVKLIHMYRKHECLWKISNKNYRRTDLKNTALQNIAEELKINIEEVKKKIRNLRNTYVHQKKKIKNEHKSGSGVDGNNNTWFLFEEMRFLDEVIVLRKTTSNFECDQVEITESNDTGVEFNVAEEATDFENVELHASTSKNMSQRQTKKINKYDAAIAELCSTEHSKPLTIFETFSSTVAAQLEQIHQLDVAEAFSVMQEIQNIIGNKIMRLLKPQPSETKISSCKTCSQKSKYQKPKTSPEDHPSHHTLSSQHYNSSMDFSLPDPYDTSRSHSTRLSNFDTASNPRTILRPSASTPIDHMQYDLHSNSPDFCPQRNSKISSPSNSPNFSNITLFTTSNSMHSTNDRILNANPPYTFNSRSASPASISCNIFHVEPTNTELSNNTKKISLPDSNKIKILEDVTIKHSNNIGRCHNYTTSFLLNDALTSAEIIDGNGNTLC